MWSIYQYFLDIVQWAPKPALTFWVTNQRALKSPNHSIAAYFPPSCSQGFNIGNCQTWYWVVTCSTFGISLTAPVTLEDEHYILYTSVYQCLAQNLRGTLYTVYSQQRLVWKICLIWYEFNEALLSRHWHFSFLAIHRHTLTQKWSNM